MTFSGGKQEKEKDFPKCRVKGHRKPVFWKLLHGSRTRTPAGSTLLSGVGPPMSAQPSAGP